jgi:hypothetical protein
MKQRDVDSIHFKLTLIVMLLVIIAMAGCGGGSNAPAPPPAVPPPVIAPPPPPPAATCTDTLSWQLDPSDTGDLTHGHLYVTLIPLVEEFVAIIQVDAYVLQYVRSDVPEGHHYYRLTVTNEYGESPPSNTVDKECS